MTDWRWADAITVRDAVSAGTVSAEEITRTLLDWVDEVDRKVDAYTQVWREEALERARNIDARRRQGEPLGPLAGVPIGLKELLCTRQGFTTCASRILAGFRSPYDATVVRRLEAADAVFLGKVNMDEFAMGSSTERSAIKVTRNPWNLNCVPGGSSGGSAAAVVSGQCAVSLGSDTGGSIRQPAALCGCVGIKPTYGRVSRYGLVAFASSLDQIGPLTRTVEDAALVLDVICGKDPMDATSAPLPAPEFLNATRTGDIRGLRVGLPKEYFTDALSDEAREAVLNAVKVLESAGASVVEVSLPHSPYAIAAYYIICTAEASANLARFDGVRYGFRHPDAKTMEEMYDLSRTAGFGPEVKRRILLGTYVLSSGYYDAYYLKAQKVRRLIKRDFDQAFEACDVIAGPTSPTPAFEFGAKTDNPLEMYLSDIYTISVNLATLPGLSIPCGLSRKGLPIGLQLIGKPFDEATLLRTARHLEKSGITDIGRPPLA
ncbi:MAG TPA: Asp-tRNA(Asn)/Glu-tRNA(Gln) amidotransferase subunit GatA [Candidatus Hydrogenedentes bacterium]|nr:Asp-tRNA(Asn)/Glu-tRNA(Gln) amidotransferase subunit GatA [Candidatus Hydrogenedentota bacterium]